MQHLLLSSGFILEAAKGKRQWRALPRNGECARAPWSRIDDFRELSRIPGALLTSVTRRAGRFWWTQSPSEHGLAARQSKSFGFIYPVGYARAPIRRHESSLSVASTVAGPAPRPAPMRCLQGCRLRRIPVRLLTKRFRTVLYDGPMRPPGLMRARRRRRRIAASAPGGAIRICGRPGARGRAG